MRCNNKMHKDIDSLDFKSWFLAPDDIEADFHVRTIIFPTHQQDAVPFGSTTAARGGRLDI
jgi:hypothetical protein